MRLLSKIWILFVLTIFVQSCSCKFYYNQLEKKCPKVRDSIIVRDTVYSKPVIDSGAASVAEFERDSLFFLIQSIVDEFNREAFSKDSLIKMLQTSVGGTIKRYKCIKDTVTVLTHGGWIKLWQNDRMEIKFQINIPPQKVPFEKVVYKDKIVVKQDYFGKPVQLGFLFLALAILIGVIMRSVKG